MLNHSRRTRGARRPLRGAAVIAASSALLLNAAGLAHADNILNDIGASGTTTLTLNGSTVQTTVNYNLEKNGNSNCSASSTTHIIYDVSIGAPSGVTASPTKLDFTDCTTKIPVTFTATSAGTRTVSLTKDASSVGSANPNNATFSLVVNGSRNTAPTVTVGGVVDGATYEFGSVGTPTCSVVDAEDGSSSPTPTLSAITGTLSSYGLGSQTATCSYTDNGGISRSASATYSIVDTTKPVLDVSGDKTFEATSPSGAEATWVAPTASDAVGIASPGPSCDFTSPHTFDLGPNKVTCSVSDVAGNTTSRFFTVTIADKTQPSLTTSSDVTTEATGPNGSQVSYDAPTATDNYDVNLVPSCDPPSGSTFAVGSHAVTCSVSDHSGNTASGSFTVTVQDTTAPTLTLPDNITAEATSPNGAEVNFTTSAQDLVDGLTSVTCDHASGDGFAFGATTVSCSATDAHHNTATGTFDVTVQDTRPPTIADHDTVTREATSSDGAVVDYVKPSATDVASTDVQVDCIPASGRTFAIATTQVNCTATDAHGNTAASHFDVTVVDTTPPTVSVPANITAEASGPSGAAVTFSASATDLVDGTTTVTCDHASGSNFALGDTTVACSSTDAAGNTGSGSFRVTVQDKTAPTLNLPADKSVQATSANGASVNYSATATDLVDGTVTPSCAPASGTVFALGSTTVTCTATDAHGNAASGSFKVAVAVPWNGILQPINSDGSSVFKQGSTVPVKFAGFPGLTATLRVAQVANSVEGTSVEALSTSAADTGNQFRYDSTAGQYIFNLSTKSLSAGTYVLHINLGDGTDNTVKISVKK